MAATVVKGGEAGSPSRAGERRAILVRSRRAVSTKKAPRRVPGGAVRDRSAALLGTSSHARNPATDNNNSAEGAAKEEDALVLHGQFSIRRQERASRVKTSYREGGNSTERTVKRPPSLRPRTAGLYISSAWVGGRTKTPAVVARATYDAW